MLISLIFLASLATASNQTSPEAGSNGAAEKAVSVPFDQRKNERVLLTRSIRNFDVRREDGSDRVVYLETGRNAWLRGEMSCFGAGDPRDAHAIDIKDHTGGLDVNSTLVFRQFAAQSSECRLNNLVALTQEEALERKLIRAPKPKKD